MTQSQGALILQRNKKYVENRQKWAIHRIIYFMEKSDCLAYETVHETRITQFTSIEVSLVS